MNRNRTVSTRRTSVGVAVASLALLGTVSLSACSQGVGAPRVDAEEATVMTPIATMRSSAIPPIDAAVPARIETATFALG
ncbi:MAG: hypothetical protein HYR85_11905 [Planctomycetes bacterium]|nr:hypothetical protein [Planctomycetota bacterium]MBI3843939.1 hypothetical protein [Planctomycetota bacterium]